MKKTLITLLALTGVAMGAEGFQYSGDFSWGSGKELTFSFDENIALSMTELSSAVGYNAVGYKTVTSEGYTSAYSPDTNVGSGGTWTLSFKLENSSSEAITLTGISFDFFTFTNGGVLQPDNSQRSLTFSLKGGNFDVSKDIDSNYYSGSTNCVLDLGDATTTIAAGEFVEMSLTVVKDPKATGDKANGTYVGLSNMCFTTASAVPAVPEPATATLSLLALAGLAARRRRK